MFRCLNRSFSFSLRKWKNRNKAKRPSPSRWSTAKEAVVK